ncbi:MAG: ABC transporter permease [Candidatus Methylomirabilales bacterium]
MQTAGVPHVDIQPTQGLFPLGLRDVWGYRELLYFLAWRDIKVRYKQTAIGAAWAVLQPLIAMAIFTVVFGHFARIPSDGLPYPPFALAALLPWNFFAQALGRGAASLVANAHLLTKVYFPRLLLPLAAAMLPALDFLVSLSALAALMLWYGVAPSWRLLLLPVFILLAFLAAMAVSLLLAPINVRYRDVGHAVPFLIQIWLFASPVVYPSSLVPEPWRLLYSLNPLVGVIDGFRWALFGTACPDPAAMAVSGAAVAWLSLGGLLWFRRSNATFADVV